MYSFHMQCYQCQNSKRYSKLGFLKINKKENVFSTLKQKTKVCIWKIYIFFTCTFINLHNMCHVCILQKKISDKITYELSLK